MAQYLVISATTRYCGSLLEKLPGDGMHEFHFVAAVQDGRRVPKMDGQFCDLYERTVRKLKKGEKHATNS